MSEPAFPGAKRFYHPKELVPLLRFSLSKIYEMLDDGELPAIKIHNRWKIPKASFDRYLDDLDQRSTDKNSTASN